MKSKQTNPKKKKKKYIYIYIYIYIEKIYLCVYIYMYMYVYASEHTLFHAWLACSDLKGLPASSAHPVFWPMEFEPLVSGHVWVLLQERTRVKCPGILHV